MAERAITLSPSQIRSFRRAVLRCYDLHHRQLPWRRNRDPYRIWVSEIMLQQTRVAAVLDHYARFITAFPPYKRWRPQRKVRFWPPGAGWATTIARGGCMKRQNSSRASVAEYFRIQRNSGWNYRGLAGIPRQRSPVLRSMKRWPSSMAMSSACCNGFWGKRWGRGRRGGERKSYSTGSAPAISTRR